MPGSSQCPVMPFAPCVVRSGTPHFGASRGSMPASCCGPGCGSLDSSHPKPASARRPSSLYCLGVAGGVAALAFSAVVRLAYRGRRLREINWVKGGLLAGLVTGLAFPLFLQAMNLLSGDGLIAWSLVLDDGPLVGVLAAVTAGGTLSSHSAWMRSPGQPRRSARRWLPGQLAGPSRVSRACPATTAPGRRP